MTLRNHRHSGSRHKGCAIPRGTEMSLRKSIAPKIIISILLLAILPACDVERRKSDAELGLTPQQSAGRKLYDNYCDRCHRPYSTKGRKGPGLKGLFQNKFLPQTG